MIPWWFLPLCNETASPLVQRAACIVNTVDCTISDSVRSSSKALYARLLYGGSDMLNCLAQRFRWNSAMSQDSALPSTVDDALTAAAAGFSIAAAAFSIAVPPAAVALGVTAGGAQLVQLVQRRFGKRLSQVAHGARERLGDGEAVAARRLTEDEDLAALAYQALDASMLSHHEEQAWALGRVLGEALKGEPTISVDEASMVIEALRFVDLPHLRALRAMPSRWGLAERLDLASAIGTDDEAMMSGVVMALQRAGLVELSVPTVSEAIRHARSSSSGEAEPAFVLSAFGRRILDYTK